jgi:3-phosphoshikimate 1-carboxyvinyltransferase
MASLPDVLPILPFTHPARGEVRVPGSKSLTNRALLLAALCDRPVTLTGALFSEDTELMAEALRRLGVRVEADAAAATVRVDRQAAAFNSGGAEIFVGLAGTAARFLTAFCAAAPQGVYRIDGVPQMRKRPMKGLIDALRQLGADIRCPGEEGFFPLEIHARGLRGGPVSIDASESSQMLSALLMVAPLAQTPVEVKPTGQVRWPFVEMTMNLMGRFGLVQSLLRDGAALVIPLGRYVSPREFAIEPDATAASYFAALPLVTGGSIFLPDLSAPKEGLQGDTQFLRVIERIGATVAAVDGDVDVRVARPAKLAGVEQDFREFSDTFLTLAAIAPLLDGPTHIAGIAHTRKQETDRVAGAARELRKLGQEVVETEDALEIHPRPLVRGVEIETYGDHRFAMSFAILGCHNLHGDGRSWLAIRNPACCAKTFPHFFELLDQVRQNSVGD